MHYELLRIAAMSITFSQVWHAMVQASSAGLLTLMGK